MITTLSHLTDAEIAKLNMAGIVQDLLLAAIHNVEMASLLELKFAMIQMFCTTMGATGIVLVLNLDILVQHLLQAQVAVLLLVGME